LLILLSMQINTEKNSSCTSPTAHKKQERTKAELSTIDKQKSFREKSRPTSALLGKLPLERIRPEGNYRQPLGIWMKRTKAPKEKSALNILGVPLLADAWSMDQGENENRDRDR
jgi:hypothetical protein